MLMKVSMPGHFKLKSVSNLHNVLFSRSGDIHYIGGAEVLPAPLEPKKEQDEKPEPPKEPEVKPEEKDMVICKRCQTRQRITNQYCKHCGESFVPLERCGKCGREVPKNAIYCPFCGKKR